MSEDIITKAVLTADGRVLIEQADGSFRVAKPSTDWVRLDRMTDAEIEANAASDPDSPPLDDQYFENASPIGRRARSFGTALPIDAEVLSWFQKQGEGWHVRLNDVLRRYYEQHRDNKPRGSGSRGSTPERP